VSFNVKLNDFIFALEKLKKMIDNNEEAEHF